MQAVGHHAPRGAAAPGAHGNAVALGVVDKILDDEKIVHKAHCLDDAQLILQLLVHLGILGKALPEALLAELPEIGVAVCLPLGELEAGQMIVAKLKIVGAALGDPDRVVRRLGVVREKRAHLLLVLEIKLLCLKAHAVFLVHSFARLDAHQHVLVLRVLFFQVVRVIGQGQGDARLFAQADEPPGRLGLLGDAVVLDLQIEVLFPEKPPQIQRPGLRGLVIAVDQRLRDLARETAGEANEPLRVLVQQRPVDPGADVIALGEAGAHQIAEVPVAGLVAAEQDQMGVFVLRAGQAVKAALGRHIDLAADDGLDPLGKAGFIKGHRAVHHAVIRDGQGGLAQLLGALGDLVDAAGPVQQGILRMHM